MAESDPHERDKFETWMMPAIAELQWEASFKQRDDGGYFHSHVDNNWRAWKARGQLCAPPIDASRAEDAWISVAERLGPPHQNVLCLNRDGNVFTGRVCYGMHKPFWTLPRNYDDPSNTAPSWIDVTHWMPLPAPPARALATDGDDRG